MCDKTVWFHSFTYEVSDALLFSILRGLLLWKGELSIQRKHSSDFGEKCRAFGIYHLARSA